MLQTESIAHGTLLAEKYTLNIIIATDKIIARNTIQARYKCKAQWPMDKIIASDKNFFKKLLLQTKYIAYGTLSKKMCTEQNYCYRQNYC